MVLSLFLVATLIGLLFLFSEKIISKSYSEISYKIWAIIAAQSFVLSIWLGFYVWNSTDRLPQPFTDLISGHLAFNNEVKVSEHYGLYTAIFCFVLCMLGLSIFYEKVIRYPEAAKSAIYRILLYALIPSAILAGQSLRTETTLYLLNISVLTIVLSLITAVVLSILLNRGSIYVEQTWETGIKILFTIIFMLVSLIGISILYTRVGIRESSIIMKVGALLAVMSIAVLILRCLRLFSASRALDIFFTATQFGIPLIFLLLLPPYVTFSDGTYSFLRLRPALYLGVGGLLLVAYGDVIRRYWKKKSQTLTLQQSFSPWIIFAVLLFVQSYPWSWTGVGDDNYHLGEFYLPFWQLRKFGYLPFADYQPARGLINYLPGLFSWLFADGRFSSDILFRTHFDAVILLIGFWGLRSSVGNLAAFLSMASIFMFQGNMLSGLVIIIAALGLVCKLALTRPPLFTLWVWLAVAIFTSLFVVTEGPLFIICTLPLVTYLLYQTWIRDRKALFVSVGILAVVTIVLLLATRTGEVLLGFGRYLVEQSNINDVAHGIPWTYPIDIRFRVTSGYLWQFVRYSWLLLIVPIVQELLLFRSVRTMPLPNKIRWFWLVAILIMVVLIITRANGRTDPVDYSRPGLASLGLVIIALPFLLLWRITNPEKRAVAFLAIALVFGLLGYQENLVRSAMLVTTTPIYVPANTRSGDELGLTNLGPSVIISEEQVTRQLAIKEVLDALLKPEETYFDATSMSADYGYQGRRCPITDCAPYNSPAEPQQIRAIQKLDEQQIPLVLLNAEGFVFDGGSFSIRSYWVYRYLLEKYVPFEDKNGFVWMIRKGQESRLTGTSYQVNPSKSLEFLTRVLWQEQLRGLPDSWGASFNSLEHKLSNQVDLMAKTSIITEGTELLDMGAYQIVNESGKFIFDVPDTSEADVLYIETDKPIDAAWIKVEWSSDLVPEFGSPNMGVFDAKSDRYLFPISSAPSWAMSNTGRRICISFPEDFRDQVLFKRIVLYERTSALSDAANLSISGFGSSQK